MNVIKVTKFHSAIKAASSMPLIVSDAEEKKYVIKLKGGGDGVLANMVEWIAFNLANELQIPVLEHTLLSIDEQLVEQADDPEIRELLEKSTGVNFGSVYLEDAESFTNQTVSQELKERIYLFDVFLINIDRTVKNPNVAIKNDNIFCLDFSSSFMLRYCIDDSFFTVDTALKELRKHPFYTAGIDPQKFISDTIAIPDSRLEELIMTMPDVWTDEHFDPAYADRVKIAIVNRLKGARNAVSKLPKTLALIQSVLLETESERVKQIKANKEEFEKKFGKM
jgi:hypothetical protein